MVRSKHKIRSFAFSSGALKKGVEAQLALSLHNNSIEVQRLSAPAWVSQGPVANLSQEDGNAIPDRV